MMHSATRLETGRVDHRGQALTEWVIILGTIALVAVLVFAVFGAVLHRQSGRVATELAGGGATRQATSATIPQSIIQLASLSGLRGLFSQLPGASDGDPGGSGSAGHGSFTPIPSAAGGATGSPVQCNRNDGQAGVGAMGLPSQGVGNPIHIVTGNKYQEEVDLPALPGRLGLRFARHYNSHSQGPWGLGPGWRHSYQVQVRTAQDHIWIWQADGRQIRFDRGETEADSSVSYTAQRAGDGKLVYRPQQGYEWHWISGRVLHFGLNKQLVRMHEGHREVRFYYDADGRLVEVRDPHQRTLHLSYYANGRPATVKGPDGNLIGYRYDTIGNLTHVIYPDNTFRRYHYEDERHPHHLTGVSVGTVKRQGDEILAEDDTRWSTYRYDAQGRGVLTMRANGVDQVTLSYGVNEVRVTDAVGRISTYAIELRDGVPLVTAVYGPGCSECGQGDVAYTYTERFQLATITTRDGITVRNTYDNRGRLHQQHRVLPDGTEQWLATYRYRDAAGAPLGVPVRIERPSINPSGVYATEYNYSAYGQPESIIETGYAPTLAGEYTTLQRVTRYRYDRFGRLVVIDGPRDDVEDTFQLRYDADDNLQTITRPDGTVARILTRDGAGRPTRLQIGRQLPIDMRYTARGQLTEASQPIADGLVRTVRYAYNPLGLLTAVTGSDGTVREFSYDAAGRGIRVSDSATGLSRQIAYARDGSITGTQLIGPQDEVLRSLRYAYDAHRRLSEIEDGEGEILARYVYADDRVQRPNQLIDPSGRVTQFAYGPLGQLTQMTDPKGGTTALDYDTQGLASVTDPNGHTTHYRRDDFGRTVTVLSPDTGIAWSTYDAADNLIEYTDARGKRIRIAYDAANRPITRATDEGVTTFDYDQGWVTEIAGPYGRELFERDDSGRVIKHHRELDRHSFTITYRYDPVTGRLTEKALPDGQVLHYDYHDGGALRAITRQDLFGQTVLIGEIQNNLYDGRHRYSHSNGITAETIFDIRNGRVARRVETDLLRLDYKYDADGQIIDVRSERQWAGVSTSAYDYDLAGRLIEAHTQTGDYVYEYDPVGNRVSQTVNGERTHYYYGSKDNRLLNVKTDPARHYAYDATGNPVQIGERRYVYDVAGRPVRLYHRERLLAEYVYNPQGERTKKTVHGSFGQTRTTYYLYEDSRLTAEADADGRITVQYFYLDHQPVAVLKDRRIYAIHTDHLGAPRAVTDSNKQLLWHADYSPFGEVRVDQDPDQDGDVFRLALRLPGQYDDDESGTYYNYFRYYDPTTGRYITSDPIGLDGGVNTYTYVSNNPLTSIDPLGLAEEGAAIGGTIGGVVGGVIGGVGGGAACTVVAPGVGTISCGGGGAIEGAAIGAVIGAAAGSAIQDFCKNDDDDDCQQLYAQIDRLVNQLQTRHREIRENKLNLPATGPFSVGTHQQQFRERQAQLRKLLNKANTKGCTNYRSDAWISATRPEPSPAG